MQNAHDSYLLARVQGASGVGAGTRPRGNGVGVMAPRALSVTRRSARLATAAALAVAATLVAAPAHAGPAATCGMTITSDYTLRSDLRCSGTAIRVVVGDPGQTITLDLGRRAVIGDGTGSGVQITAETGGAVVVRNGQIRGFQTAVGGSGVLDLALRRLTVRDNGAWLGQGPLYPLTLTVERSTIVDSGLGGGNNETRTIVRRSHFVRSGIDSTAQTYTDVYDSTFIGGGVRTGRSANVVAERNTFLRCDVGVDAADSWPGSPTVVRGNRFVGCRTGMELRVAAAGSGANGVTVARNHFLGNAEEGLRFAVLGPFGTIDIVGNHAVGNGGTGIAGTGAGVTTVARNTASRNGGHGIDVSGVIDGGGNVARWNATPPQCLGVACAGR